MDPSTPSWTSSGPPPGQERVWGFVLPWWLSMRALLDGPVVGLESRARGEAGPR